MYRRKEESFMKRFLHEVFSHEIRNLFVMVAIFVLAGTVFYTNVEAWRAFDALYFSVMTLTTVGYGDLAPVTDAGKLFTIFYVFGGLGIVLTFLTTLAREQAKEPFFYRLINRNNREK